VLLQPLHLRILASHRGSVLRSGLRLVLQQRQHLRVGCSAASAGPV
jgi:hypothetical protein